MQNTNSTEAFVALGSNLGDSRRILQTAFQALQTFSRAPIRCSSLWRSLPEECPPGSPDFLNGAAALIPFPDETPETLLAKLQWLEAEFGRRPKLVHNEPRPLDLDLIAFGSEIRSTPTLILPHPRAHRRAFVINPLAEVAPDLVLPGQSESVAKLAGQFSGDSHSLPL